MNRESYLTDLIDVQKLGLMPKNLDKVASSVYAGIYSKQKDIIGILFSCEDNELNNHHHVFLATYAKTGSFISMQSFDPSPIVEDDSVTTFINTEPRFLNDSIIELRSEKTVRRNEDESTDVVTTEILIVKTAGDGQIVALPKEDISFDAYLQQLPEIKLPLILNERPATGNYKPVSLLNPFFKAAKYIFADRLRLYEVGKINSGSRFPIVLYANDTMQLFRQTVYSGYWAVVYDKEGKETDRTILLGNSESNGCSLEQTSATIAIDGNIQLTETEEIPAFWSYTNNKFNKFSSTYNLQVNDNGKFTGTLEHLKITSDFFNTDTMRSYLEEMMHSGMGTNPCEMIAWLPFRKKVGLLFYTTHTLDGNLAGEVLLGNSENKMTDRLVLYKSIKNDNYKSPSFEPEIEDITNLHTYNQTFLNKPVEIEINNQQYLITASGKFQKQ